jgi:predicted hydrocarbon binding protein
MVLPKTIQGEREGLQEGVTKREKAGFVMEFDTFCAFKSALEEIFSPSAAHVILGSAANKCGRQSCKNITKKIKDKGNVLAYLSHRKESMNWGEITFQEVDLQNGKGKIQVNNSFESLMLNCAQPSCHFLGGFFVGFLSELFNREISVTEVKCAGKGDDNYRFEFE